MYRNILIAVDLDRAESWEPSIAVGSALARCFAARLTLCTVVRDAEAVTEAEWSAIGYRRMHDIARARLAELAAAIPGQEAGVEIGSGTISGGILDVAERTDADLIVMASHAPALRDYVLAANALRVVRRAPCSVLVVRGEGDRSDPGRVGTIPLARTC